MHAARCGENCLHVARRSQFMGRAWKGPGRKYFPYPQFPVVYNSLYIKELNKVDVYLQLLDI